MPQPTSIDQLQKDIRDMENQLRVKETDLKRSEGKLKDAEREVVKVNDVLQKVTQKRDHEKQLHDSLVTEVDKIRQELSNHHAEITKLERELKRHK